MAANETLVRASTFITIDADGEVTDTETIVVGGKTYTFDATVDTDDGDVHVAADAEGHCKNLVAAINVSDEGENGVADGTDYAVAMTRNPCVYAEFDGVDIVTLRALVPGSIGNVIPVTAGTSGVTVDNATLENGEGNIAGFVEGLLDLNQINSEVQSALKILTPAAD